MAGIGRVPLGLSSRPLEARAVTEFLGSVSTGPSALVVEGEPGIGKTTMWSAASEQARECGFQVLVARAAPAESVMAYAALADLLGGVDAGAFADLPSPQRLAVDRILMRVDADGAATDQRAVTAAFLSVVESIAEQTRVLVAIDDVQWLDPSSAHVVGFAARRVAGRVGMLATVRTGTDESGASWLQLPVPARIQRIQLRPLTLGALHAVVSARLGRSFSRPTMVRIHEVSGGNPFYAIELARAIGDQSAGSEVPLPSTLAEVVRARIGGLDAEAHDVLLATACLAAPTVEQLERATNTAADHLIELLEEAEGKGILAIEGNRLRFAHPLLARGVYDAAAAAQRRRMHRRLAEVVEQPELCARHLALGATRGDPVTLQALDAAAESARIRGAPTAAAELLDLAVGLGGGTPERRIRSAAYHSEAGEPARARELLEGTIERLGPGTLRAQALHQLAVVGLLNNSFLEAAGLLERALGDAGEDLALRVQILVSLSFALFNAGQVDAAVHIADDAVTQACRLGAPQLLSVALSMRVMLRFLCGDGLDEPSLQRALQLEDRHAAISLAFRPSVHNALLLAWTGQLDLADERMLSFRRQCLDRGDEGELTFVDFHTVLIRIWRGAFAEATLMAEDAMERALQLGGDLPLSVALTLRATLAAYAGREHEARRDANDALAAFRRSSSFRLREWPVTVVGFLDVSLGNYQGAMTTLEPLLAHLDPAANATEIIAASFVPDAVEAMIALSRLAEAEPLIEALERNGRRLDRAWMEAVGARCRSMLLAAQGDIDAATNAVRSAMNEHQRLPMPFERARTQLFFGQLQRRQRHWEAASATLHEALGVFETLNTPLWAERARASLARTNVGANRATVLAPSERRVAELAASGMTNRDIAAALFISPKTVEVNLSHIYRKLDIRSRAELGRRMDRLNK